jgi:hypothetical protein
VYASSATGLCHNGPLIWLRIADNGTNRIVSFSVDGVLWTALHTVGRTDFITPNQVGFYVNAANATWGIGMFLVHWEET